MINNVTLVGRITKAPELKKTQSGHSVVSFTLAVNRLVKNDAGEREADFINCVAWRNSADFMNTYVQKGNLLGIVGKLQTRNYEQDGRTVYVTEVVCDSVQLLETNKPQEKQMEQPFYEEKTVIVDDDLPF